MADPLDFETVAAVGAFSGLEIRTTLAAEQEILDAIEKHYGEEEQQVLAAGGEDEQAIADLEHLRDMASEAPVIRLVNAMIGAGHREARQRYPHRAVRERVPRPLPRGWRAVQPGDAAARAESRHHLAR